MTIILTYTGRGAFVPGVPARDLTVDDVERLGGVTAIVKRCPAGLYIKAAPVKRAASKKQTEGNNDGR
jgi:hypothetical protein